MILRAPRNLHVFSYLHIPVEIRHRLNLSKQQCTYLSFHHTYFIHVRVHFGLLNLSNICIKTMYELHICLDFLPKLCAKHFCIFFRHINIRMSLMIVYYLYHMIILKFWSLEIKKTTLHNKGLLMLSTLTMCADDFFLTGNNTVDEQQYFQYIV